MMSTSHIGVKLGGVTQSLRKTAVDGIVLVELQRCTLERPRHREEDLSQGTLDMTWKEGFEIQLNLLEECTYVSSLAGRTFWLLTERSFSVHLLVGLEGYRYNRANVDSRKKARAAHRSLQECVFL